MGQPKNGVKRKKVRPHVKIRPGASEAAVAASYDAELDPDDDGCIGPALHGHGRFARFLREHGIGTRVTENPDYD